MFKVFGSISNANYSKGEMFFQETLPKNVKRLATKNYKRINPLQEVLVSVSQLQLVFYFTVDSGAPALSGSTRPGADKPTFGTVPCSRTLFHCS